MRCPSSEDSIYLGDALDKILFPVEGATTPLDHLNEALEARFEEVYQRSPAKDPEEWLLENGWRVDESEIPRDPYGMEPFITIEGDERLA